MPKGAVVGMDMAVTTGTNEGVYISKQGLGI
jgi:hypothetical protein